MSRKRKMLFATALVLSTALSALGIAQELRQEGKYWVGEIRKNFKVEKNGNLILDGVRGEVVVKAWDKNEVSIHEIKKMDIFTKAEAEAAMKNTETGYVQQGNSIRVGGPAFDRNWIHSTFTIFVPAETECDIKTKGGGVSVEGTKGNITATTGGGGITLQDVGGTVKASTGGGEVRITGSRGPVTVTTGGGEVRIVKTQAKVKVNTGGGVVEIQDTHGAVEVNTGGGNVHVIQAEGSVSVNTGGGSINVLRAGGDVSVNTGGGSIHVNDLKGNISANTGGGDVELNGVQGGIDASTGGGDVTAELTLADFSIRHKINVKTGSGDIRLTLPEKIPAVVRATIHVTERRGEDYQISSEFPLKITTDNSDSRMRMILATGEVNGGGDPIDLETTNGNIRIVKAQK